MGCTKTNFPIQTYDCYCNINPAILLTEKRSTPDLCNFALAHNTPCDMRPYINKTVTGAPFLVNLKSNLIATISKYEELCC